MKRLIIPAILLAGLPFAASAGEVYIGAGAGQVSIETAKFIQDFCDGCQNFSDSQSAYSVYLGYQITDAVAVELDYVDGGKLKDSFSDFCTPCTGTVEPQVTSLVGVGSVPLTGNLRLFGKAGVAFVSADSTFDSGEGVFPTDSISTQDLTLGTGLEYRAGRWRIRGEGQWIDIEDTNKALIIMISAAIGFGGSN
jgi:opacity protein-like surface antigen